MINVSNIKGNEYKVIIEQHGSSTMHTVTLDDTYHEKITHRKIQKEDLIKRSFEFLLQRESKESILGRFNLNVIGKYFPEYERIISI